MLTPLLPFITAILITSVTFFVVVSSDDSDAEQGTAAGIGAYDENRQNKNL